MNNRTRKCLATGSADLGKHAWPRAEYLGALMNFKISAGHIPLKSANTHPMHFFLSRRITNNGLQLLYEIYFIRKVFTLILSNNGHNYHGNEKLWGDGFNFSLNIT